MHSTKKARSANFWPTVATLHEFELSCIACKNRARRLKLREQQYICSGYGIIAKFRKKYESEVPQSPVSMVLEPVKITA